MWKAVFLVVYLAIDLKVDGSQDAMRKISLNFKKALDDCKKEENLSDSIDADFANYWKEGYEMTNREAGCAVICLSKKLELLTDDGTLHHGNIQDFTKLHGADEGMAKQLVDALHGCDQAAPDEEKCIKVVHIMNCFKREIHKLDWAPDMDLVVAEVLAEV